MKLEVVTSAVTEKFTERVVLVGADGREVHRGYAPPFAEGEKEELEFQGRVFALHGESMGCKVFKDAGPVVIVPPAPEVKDEQTGETIPPPAVTAPSP